MRAGAGGDIDDAVDFDAVGGGAGRDVDRLHRRRKRLVGGRVGVDGGGELGRLGERGEGQGEKRERGNKLEFHTR